MNDYDDFGNPIVSGEQESDMKPRRRRDTWLYYSTIITLALQVVVAAFPEVCSAFGPHGLLGHILNR